MNRALARLRPIGLVIVLQGALLGGPAIATSSNPPVESTFASVDQPIGVAASLGRVLVTRPFCGNPRQVVAIDSTGSASVFARLPDRTNEGACGEDYLAVAPASPNPTAVPGFPTKSPAGFTSNDVFVSQGATIIRVAFDASSVTTFARLPACGNDQSGITFDRAGSFHFRLIVVCSTGQVWLLDKNGHTVQNDDADTPTPNPIATMCLHVGEWCQPISGPFEGPDVAPLSAGNNPHGFDGGDLLVAADHAGRGAPPGEVFAVSPSGWVKPVAAVPFAEGSLVIPAVKCTLGRSNGTYFTTIYPMSNTIDQLPLSAFSGFSGNALVPTEQNPTNAIPFPGLTLLSPMGATSTFRPFFAPHQGAAFTDCTAPLLLPTVQIPRDPHDINPNTGGVVTMKILTSVDFDPSTIIQNTIRYGFTGTEDSLARPCDLTVDQGAGHAPFLLCKFAKNKLGIPSHGVYRGMLILKLQYNGPTGDGEGEGGD